MQKNALKFMRSCAVLVAMSAIWTNCQKVSSDSKDSSNRSEPETSTTVEETSSTTEIASGETGSVDSLAGKITVKAGSFSSPVKVSLTETSMPTAASSFTAVSKAVAVKVTNLKGETVREIAIPLSVNLKDVSNSGKDLWVLIVENPGTADEVQSLVKNPKVSGSEVSFSVSATDFTAVVMESLSSVPSGVKYIISEDGLKSTVSTSTSVSSTQSSTSSTTTTTTVDTTPPTLSISSPSASITATSNITYTVTYSGADAVTLATADVTVSATGSATGSATVSGSGTATRTVTISSISGNGTLGITLAAATASDTAGNKAVASSASTTFTVDNTAPLTPSLSVSSGSFSGTISVTVSQNATTDANFSDFRYTTSGTAPTSCSDGTSSSNGSLSLSASADITLKVIACDTAGNKSSDVTGTYTYVASATSNKSLFLDGSDDYVTASDASLPSGSSSRTIAMWVKPVTVSGDPCLFIYGSGGTGQMMALVVESGALHMTQNGSGFTGGTISADVWQHVMYTYDSSSTTHVLYINNAQVASSSAGFTFNTQLGGSINIGRYLSGNNYLKGTVDDVRVYDKVLSSSERAQIYNNGEGLSSNSITGLVGWWKLDDGTGTTATDSSSSGRNGTLTSGPMWSYDAMPGNRSVSFDGSNDRIAISDSASLNFTSAMTISAWVNPTTLTSSTMYTIASQDRYSSNQERFLFFLYGNSLGFLVSSDGTTGSSRVTVYGGTVSTSAWQHVAATFDGSTNYLRVYVNGTLVGSSSSAPSSMYYTSMPLQIGAREANTGGTMESHFNGLMDDLRLYSKALNSTEITAIYNSGNGSATNTISNLAGWWKLDGSATTAFDASGNANHGTLTNGPTWYQIGKPTGWPLPLTIANLSLSLDAAAITGLSGGAAVATWPDRSLNFNSGTQSTAGNKPTYRTSGQNSLPALAFDGDDYLALSSNLTQKPFTAIMVSAGAGYLIGGPNGALEISNHGNFHKAMTAVIGTVDNEASAIINGGTTDEWKITAARYDSSGNWKTIDNTGVAKTGSNNQSFSQATGYIGGSVGSSIPGYLNGKVAEVLYYSAALTDTELADIIADLKSKYNM